MQILPSDSNFAKHKHNPCKHNRKLESSFKSSIRSSEISMSRLTYSSNKQRGSLGFCKITSNFRRQSSSSIDNRDKSTTGCNSDIDFEKSIESINDWQSNFNLSASNACEREQFSAKVYKPAVKPGKNSTFKLSSKAKIFSRSSKMQFSGSRFKIVNKLLITKAKAGRKRGVLINAANFVLLIDKLLENFKI
uniref:Uncharacterized protein n=1 Tax=Romanomermis culicivorax TaxID=13658 RepID=A0A915IQN4_ROMCU